MKLDNKVVYRGLVLLVSVLAFVGAVLAVFNLVPAAIALLGFAIALTPALGHFRMREQLSAVKRLPHSTGAAFDAQPILDQLTSLDRRVQSLTDDQSTGTKDEALFNELQDAVNQMRRESRMARIAAAQITGKL